MSSFRAKAYYLLIMLFVASCSIAAASIFYPQKTSGHSLEDPGMVTHNLDCLSGSSLNIVAHEDDDILFMNPDIQHDISAGKCVTTVYVTTGAYSAGPKLTAMRENGPKAAYAEMAGLPDDWQPSRITVNGYSLQSFSLQSDTKINLIYMRLPNTPGSDHGWPFYNYQTLQDLYEGKLKAIKTIDGTASYTRSELVGTFTHLINEYQPSVIRVQNYLSPFDDGDHNDHVAVARLAVEANNESIYPHTLIAYHDYDTDQMAIDINAADLHAKEATWQAYTPYDPEVCPSAAQCRQSHNVYYDWLTRQYRAGTITTP